MNIHRPSAFLLLALLSAAATHGQDVKPANLAAVPPNLLQLVRREVLARNESELQRLQTALSRKSDRLDFPFFWIDLESVTGSKESLLFEPFDSFEHLEEARSGWSQLYASHPDLRRSQDDISSFVASERTIIASRRDDLSHLLENIDLSEARFLRLVEVRLFPGRDHDFAEAIALISESRAKTDADAPWVVYQVTMGTPTPTFLVFSPMADLKQNDDMLEQRLKAAEATESDPTRDRIIQIAREAYASTETNLYRVNPEMSHVSNEFAAADLSFWRRPMEPELNSDANPDNVRPKKKGSSKPAVANPSKPN